MGLLLLVLMPLAVVASLQAWAVWLGRRPWAHSPARFLKWVQPVAFGGATVAALVAFRFRTMSEPPSADRAAILAAGIAEWLNSVAFYLLAADALLLVSLIGFTLWRRTGTGATVGPPGGS
jgi:hypothetical protein